jgi:hypothetical protein
VVAQPSTRHSLVRGEWACGSGCEWAAHAPATASAPRRRRAEWWHNHPLGRRGVPRSKRRRRPRRGRCSPSQSAAALSGRRGVCARPCAAAPITASSTCSSRSQPGPAAAARRRFRLPVHPRPLSGRHSADAPSRPTNAAAASAAAPPPHIQPQLPLPPHERTHATSATAARGARRFPPAAAARVASVSGSAGVDGCVGTEQCGLAGLGSVGKRECEASGNAGSERGVAGQCAHLDDVETAGIIESRSSCGGAPSGRTPQLELRSSAVGTAGETALSKASS